MVRVKVLIDCKGEPKHTCTGECKVCLQNILNDYRMRIAAFLSSEKRIVSAKMIE